MIFLYVSSSESRSPLKLASQMLISPLWTRIRALHPKPPGRWGAFSAQGEPRLVLRGARPGTEPLWMLFLCQQRPSLHPQLKRLQFCWHGAKQHPGRFGGCLYRWSIRNGIEHRSPSHLCYQAHCLVQMAFFKKEKTLSTEEAVCLYFGIISLSS